MTAKQPRRLKPELFRWLIVTAITVLAVYFTLPRLPGIQQSWDVLHRLNPAIALLALGCELISNYGPVQQYRSALRAFDIEMKWKRAIQFAMGLFTVGHVVPGGAGAAGIFAIDRLAAMGVPVAAATTVTAIVAITSLTVLAASMAVGAIIALFRGDLSFPYVVVVVVSCAGWGALAAVLYSAFRSERARVKLLRILRPIFRGQTLRNWYRQFAKSASEFAAHRIDVHVLRRIGVWSLVLWVFDMATLWLILFSFGVRLHVGVLVVGYGIANILGSIPITPSGLGFVEAGLSGALVAFGVPPSTAVVSVLGYRLFSLWIPALAGIPMYFRLQAIKRGPTNAPD